MGISKVVFSLRFWWPLSELFIGHIPLCIAVNVYIHTPLPSFWGQLTDVCWWHLGPDHRQKETVLLSFRLPGCGLCFRWTGDVWRLLALFKRSLRPTCAGFLLFTLIHLYSCNWCIAFYTGKHNINKHYLLSTCEIEYVAFRCGKLWWAVFLVYFLPVSEQFYYFFSQLSMRKCSMTPLTLLSDTSDLLLLNYLKV